MECSQTDTCASVASLPLYTHTHAHTHFPLPFTISAATPLPFLYTLPSSSSLLPHLSLTEATPPMEGCSACLHINRIVAGELCLHST